MYDIFLCKVDVSIDNLIHIPTGLILADFMFDKLVQICIAEFGDDVGIVFGGEDLMDVEDVLLIFQFLENCDFTLEQYSVYFIFEHFHIDDFDGYFLVGFVLAACVDLAGVTLANDIGESIRIVFYFFAGEGGAHLA